jgi:hypothetical protein
MAAVAKSGTPSLATALPGPECFVGSDLRAGAAIAAGDACYIASTGLVQLATGAAATAPALVDGFAALPAKSGEAITLLDGCDWHYGAALTPGTRLFLSGATPGGLDTAASTGGTVAVGKVLTATRVRLYANR